MKPLFLILLSLAAFAAQPTWAAPGAHGPNGEHLDMPASTVAPAGTAPRFEAQSETFELVGRLQGGELSILINRFATSEPVLQAQVEVQAGKLTAKAPFHADLGDYAVADEAMLEALQQPGEHALVITVLAGADSDLLDATLHVGSAADAHGHDHEDWWHDVPRSAWIAGTLLLALSGWLVARRVNHGRAGSQVVGGVR